MFKLTIKIPERRRRRSGGFCYCQLRICFTPFSSISIVDFEQVNVSWEALPCIRF